MQRHFSNRGEALAEVAAAKTFTHRTTWTKSAFPNQRGRGFAPEQWKPRPPEATIPKSSPSKDGQESPVPLVVDSDRRHG
jgi:hypothetical protein